MLFYKRTFPSLACLGPNNNLFSVLWLCHAKKPNTLIVLGKWICKASLTAQSCSEQSSAKERLNPSLCVCMRVSEEWRHLGAIINLCHFTADKGKEKAKFTEIMNIVDSSSPVSDQMNNGQAHRFAHCQINSISGRRGWRNVTCYAPL